MQNRSFISLMLAALPTLVVFVFCQRVIRRRWSSMKIQPASWWACATSIIPKLALIMLAGTLGCQQDSNSYISHIRNDLGHTRGQMTEITSSAEEAARRIVNGGHLWVAGSQSDFAFEAIGRAGGLISVRPVGNVVAGDVILVGSRDVSTESDRSDIALWKHDGAYVIFFAPTIELPMPMSLSHHRQTANFMIMATSIRPTLWRTS